MIGRLLCNLFGHPQRRVSVATGLCWRCWRRPGIPDGPKVKPPPPGQFVWTETTTRRES